jgi:hypothetical protein
LVGLVALLATGCATTRVASIKPSPELLRDCPVPTLQAGTNGQLARSAKALEDALAKCNIDKAALRELFEVPE